MSRRILASSHHRINGHRPLRTDPPCIDLQARFGKRWRIESELGADPADPWSQLIPCRAGHLYPFGDSLLAASTNTSGPLAKRLAALPCATVQQDGDDGLTVLFDVADVGRVAKIMRPRLARRLSEEQRQQCAAHLSKVRPKTLPQQRGETRQCVQTLLFG